MGRSCLNTKPMVLIHVDIGIILFNTSETALNSVLLKAFTVQTVIQTTPWCVRVCLQSRMLHRSKHDSYAGNVYTGVKNLPKLMLRAELGKSLDHALEGRLNNYFLGKAMEVHKKTPSTIQPCGQSFGKRRNQNWFESHNALYDTAPSRHNPVNV